MQNINAIPNSPGQIASQPSDVNGAQPQNTEQDSSFTRKVGTTLANVGKQAGSLGMNVASKGGEVLLDTGVHAAQEKAKDVIRLTITDRIRDFCSMIKALPYGHTLLRTLVNKVLFPYYKQANPHTSLTADLVAEKLILGHTEFLENDFIDTFDKLIRAALSPEEQQRYEQGDKKVVFKAAQNLVMNQVRTAKEPGGLKKIGRGIANIIPFVNKLPEGVKPWVGGTIGAFVAYKVLHGLWKLVKWAVIGFTGVKGFQFVKNKVSGPASPVLEEDREKPKSKLGGLVNGLGRVAQMAGGGGPGMMGGGGPGAGLGNVLGALAGAKQ